MKHTLFILFLFLFSLFSAYSQDQFTEQTSIPLTGVSYSSSVWGDYDNDGDLDILLTGLTEIGTNVSKIYRNNGDNTFSEQTSISLTGVYSGSAAWGDYDNDGDLDILLTGSGVSKIYRNNGNNSFTDQTSIVLTGVYEGSVAWGDYDNDGDLDILLTGWDGSKTISVIYRNNGNNTFTRQTSISLVGLSDGSEAWGDYDNDGDLDILLTGGTSKIYRNNGDNSFTDQTSIPLNKVSFSSSIWGDYDNDGYLDIILTGSIGTSYISKIYHNNGDNTFTDQTSIVLPGVSAGSTAWGDYDNDGYLDLLITGLAQGIGIISNVYRNNGDNTFTQTPISLIRVYLSSVDWGDYDNDGDQDILLTGWDGQKPISKIYRNNNPIANTVPSLPTNLQAVVNGNSVKFSWDKSTDNETPQNGLRYNLVIGTSPNEVNVLSPMSDRNTGYRRVVNLGNTNHCNSWTIKGLPKGQYYWSVQAIDNAFAGSIFAPEQVITISSNEHYLISYEIILPNCENPENPLVVEKGNFSEDQTIKFPEYQLPTQYGLYQPYYNALVGTELGIPEGSLSEDIKIVINLEGVCQNGLIDNPVTQGIIELFFLNIEIIGDTSGTHSPLEYYYFNNDKEAYFRIPLANIDTLMDLLNYDKDLLFPFFTLNGLNPDFNGIRKEIDSAYYIIFTKHFSELKLGIINSPNSIYTDMYKLPTEYKLEQNYPNPFNPTTKIAFSLPYETELRIVLYNMLGESVRTIAEGKFDAGFYQVNLMVKDLPSGIYVYRLESKEFISTKKLTLLK